MGRHIQTKMGKIVKKESAKAAKIIIAFLVFCTIFGLTLPAQDIPLDENSATAYIKGLITDLKVAVKDEDYLEEIRENWKSRNIVGKTKRQAIGILIADVRAVVDDPKIANNLRTKWLAELIEPGPQTTPTPSFSTPPSKSTERNPSLLLLRIYPPSLRETSR